MDDMITAFVALMTAPAKFTGPVNLGNTKVRNFRNSRGKLAYASPVTPKRVALKTRAHGALP